MTHQSRVLQGRLDHEVTRETRESVASPDQRGPRGPEAKLATLERKEGQGRLEVQEAMEYQGCLGQMAGQGLRGRKGLLAGKVPLGPQDLLGSCLDPMLCPEERVARAQWWLAIPCRRGSPGCRGRRGSKVRKGRRGRQVRQEQKAPWDPGDQVGDMDLQVKKDQIFALHISFHPFDQSGPGGAKGERGSPGPPGESSIIEVEGGGRRRVHQVETS